MSAVKLYYQEPLVRASVERLRFPDVCPVCGKSATTTVVVRLTPGQKMYLRPIDDPGFTPVMRRRLGISAPEAIAFSIPVCEKHYYSDETYTRLNTVVVCGNGLMLILFVLLSVFGVGHYYTYGVLPTWYITIAALFLSLFVLSVLSIRHPLQRALKFIGFDPSHKNVFIAVHDANYRRRLIEENPNTTELVNWILIA